MAQLVAKRSLATQSCCARHAAPVQLLSPAVSKQVTRPQVQARADGNGNGVYRATSGSRGDVASKMVAQHAEVLKHYPTAMAIDDFISRVEVGLAGFGFTGDNSIACTNLCRDEVTLVLKDKLETVFGASFNTNGLGAVLTCGVTGIKAGLSHSPVCEGGRERYVFFSFPHIAIDSNGEVGALARPGRAPQSCACGALIKCLGELKHESIVGAARQPGQHDPLEPEYSILKQRLARRIRYEGLDVQAMDLCALTTVAERTITDDLQYLIEKSVDTSRADYAVITGIEVHNWAHQLVEGGDPSMEFIVPTRAMVCVNGKITHVDLMQIPPLSFRQLQIFSQRSLDAVMGTEGTPLGEVAASVRSGVLQEIPYAYLAKRMGGASTVVTDAQAPRITASNLAIAATWPGSMAQKGDTTSLHQLQRDMFAPTMDSKEVFIMNGSPRQ